MFGLGLGTLGVVRRAGAGSGVVVPAAPVLTWSGDDEDDRPDFLWDLPSGNENEVQDAAEGDDGVIAYRENGTADPLTEYIRRTLTAGDIAGDPIAISGVGAVPSGVVLDFYSWIERGALVGDISAVEEVGPITAVTNRLMWSTDQILWSTDHLTWA